MNTKNLYEFTNDWFSLARPIWLNLIPEVMPSRILEIGSYEGASTCFLIDTLSPKKSIEIHCVDTWEGGIEHKEIGDDMGAVERRFQHNTRLAVEAANHEVSLCVHKVPSHIALSRLVAEGKEGWFDFIYIDGSHQAPDVMSDAILGFWLLRVGGTMVFDDYLWSENLPYGKDPIRCPKPAIDAFTNLFCRKIRIIKAPLYQLYIQKTDN